MPQTHTQTHNAVLFANECAHFVCVCAVLFAFALTQRYQDSNRNRFDKKELLLCSEFCDFIIHFVIVCICECGKCQTRSHWVLFQRSKPQSNHSFGRSFVRLFVRANSGRWIFRANGVRYFILLDTQYTCCVFFISTMPSPLRHSYMCVYLCVCVCFFLSFCCFHYTVRQRIFFSRGIGYFECRRSLNDALNETPIGFFKVSFCAFLISVDIWPPKSDEKLAFLGKNLVFFLHFFF